MIYGFIDYTGLVYTSGNIKRGSLNPIPTKTELGFDFLRNLQFSIMCCELNDDFTHGTTIKNRVSYKLGRLSESELLVFQTAPTIEETDEAIQCHMVKQSNEAINILRYPTGRAKKLHRMMWEL